MEFSLVGDITVETNSELIRQKYKQIIINAITFFSKETGLTIDDMKIHIVISRDYINDIKKRHYQPDEINDINSNAMFIPKDYQNEEFRKIDKAIIIVNLMKLEAYQASLCSIESIIIHELIHYYDYYFIYPNNVIDRYGKIICSQPGSIEYVIFGYFQLRSEFRAKYFQEKYIVSGMEEIKEDYMSKFLVRIEFSNNSNLFYTLSHARGQLLCWETITDENQAAKDYIEQRKNEIEDIEKDKCIKNVADIHTLVEFFDFCDKLKSAQEPSAIH
ncbi:hypothetical protein [Paenibacillus radicis (ex Xue et al. 2023)]|uniref:Uncharacterized protein n=1 Tax=Paenibacillus radicis (ex Xue et al. 2023) TaxID=2972489 RepID=A0ABT1YV17_9BACL|nr:hypothetical protein [Paenibacillus radicis (ex Xue et al. 2023)]MCR8636794.1 hypothetical protein [Paenibacillus radicis (ex Xue et al. 2023)]